MRSSARTELGVCWASSISSQPLPSPNDWSFELIEDYHAVIKETAERFGLDIVLDPLAEALAAVGHLRAWGGPARLRAAEESETHRCSLL